MRRLFILGMLLCASAAHAAVTQVQVITSNQTAGSSLVVITPTAGNALWVFDCTHPIPSPYSVSDNNNGSYTAIAISSNATSNTSCEWFYHLNVIGAATNITVTATGSTSGSVLVYELHGVAPLSTIQDHHENTGTTTSGTTTSLSVTGSGVMLLAGWGDFSATSVIDYIATAGAGWFTVNGNSVAAQCTGCEQIKIFPLGTETQFPAGTGTSTVTATLKQVGNWAGASVAIAPAAPPSGVLRHHQGIW